MNVTQTHNKNKNLGSGIIKNKILKYLYTNVKLNDKYENIGNEKDLNNIRDGDYIICPRFSGTRSWIIFVRIEEDYYAVNFPKHNQRKKQELYIHPIEINVSRDFYYGTIMEGIFFKMDKYKYLVIDEVYMLAGQKQLLKPKDDRLNELSRYIIKNTIKNPTDHIYVSQFYQTDKISLKKLYDQIKNDNKIQEIIFYPKIYGRIIYNYTIIDSDLVDHVVKITKFRMQKTEKPDVYNLFTISSEEKIGIAYIPDLDTSKTCKRWFKENKAKELMVKCQLHMEKKKWVPIELVETDIKDIDSEKEVVEV